MTTITYDLQYPSWCGAPYFKEDDYSIHLQNRLSPQELRDALHELNEVVRTYYPRRSLLYLMIMFNFIPLMIYLILIFTLGFHVAILVFFLVSEYVPLIAWFFYYFRRLKLLRENGERQIGYINQKYYNRGINFRSLNSSVETNRRTLFGVKIEVGQQETSFYQAPPPQMYTPVPLYDNMPPNYPPPNYTAPPKYTP